MLKEKNMLLIILVFSTFLGAVGQFAFKYAFLQKGIDLIVFAIGILAYGISTILYFFVLSRISLSWAYSLGGLSYIFVIIFASFIEDVPFLRIIGTGIIAIGVFLIGLS
ncbi:MAG: hypothetical protein QXS81_01845 [Candidatus Micrarchaeaceae archaeon]